MRYTIRIVMESELTEREIYNSLISLLVSSQLDPEFVEVSGKKETIVKERTVKTEKKKNGRKRKAK